MTQRVVAGVFAFAYAAAGLVHVLLTCHVMGLHDGLLKCAHDPGKSLFHVLLLPLAVFLFLDAFPVDALRRAWERGFRRCVLVLLGLAMLILTLLQARTEALDGFQDPKRNRFPVAADVRESPTPASLVALDRKLRAAVSDEDRVEIETLRAAHGAAGFQAPQGAEHEDKSLNSEALFTYLSILEERLGAPDQRDYMRQASFRAKWNAVLSWLAMAAAALLLWSFLVVMLARRSTLSTGYADAVIAVVAIISTWLVLRPYSEWYNHFGISSISTYKPLALTGLLLLATATLIWIFVSSKKAVANLSVFFSVLSGALLLIGRFRYEWIEPVAKFFVELNGTELAICYTLLGVVFAALAYKLSRP